MTPSPPTRGRLPGSERAIDPAHLQSSLRRQERTHRARVLDARRPGILLVQETVAPEDRLDENDNSIGIRVQHGSFSDLLTGDSQATERTYWEGVVPELLRDCTVLKLAHHGSRNGTDARWLAIVRPQLAVASLGASNEYGHPHPETLGLLARHQIPLLRTDLDGTITIRSDGKMWGVVSRQPLVRGPPSRDEKVAQAENRRSGVTKNPDRLIDVNSASQKELEALPGIGPVIARRIIEGRPYRAVEDLIRIKGIGEKRLAEILPYVTAR
jgi:competence protein ComEC